MKHFKFILLMLLVLVMAPALAQTDCPAIVQTVLANLDTICKDTDRNEACYGNIAIAVQPRDGVTDFSFENIGDIESVADIQALRLSPLDSGTEAWGVALMRLQASLPDTLPGQNVTFLLFGDVELVNAVNSENTETRPMQAFYLRTGIGDSACVEAPQSGLMVQTPQGVGEVSFSINGVDVAMGSTVFFQAQPGQQMNIKTLKGSAAVRSGTTTTPVIAGTEISIPMSEDLEPSGPSSDPQPYTIEEVDSLPFSVLGEDDDEFDFAPPLSEEEIDDLLGMIEDDEPLCAEDVPFLPSCDDLIHVLGGEKCELAEDGETFICDDEVDSFWSDFDETVDNGDDESGNRFFPYSTLAAESAWASTWDDGFWEEGTDAFIEDIEDGLFSLPEVENTSEDDGADSEDQTDESTAEDEVEDEADSGEEDLPPGCSAGICLSDPAEACQCVLCGIECPTDDTGDDSGSDAGGDVSEPDGAFEDDPVTDDSGDDTGDDFSDDPGMDDPGDGEDF